MNFDHEIAVSNLPLIESLYERYNQDPLSVDPIWRNYFIQLENPLHIHKKLEGQGNQNIQALIDGYRKYGHLFTKVNPLAKESKSEPWQLLLNLYGFSEDDLIKEFPTCGLLKKETAPLSEIVGILKTIYCDRVGFEYVDTYGPELEAWIQERIEPVLFKKPLSIEQKKTILEHLNHSELFESFLHTKYPGQKRFSLEGGETLIPILEATIEKGAELGAEEFIIGMAHRGRLNVLSNIMKKTHVDIFSEFDENYVPDSFEGSGDVKYHKGFFSEALTVHGAKVNIALTPNPSHLESVNPVVEGQVKAKQIAKNNPHSQNQIIPVLVHGDAALSGQGIIYETLQLSRLAGYNTGGTIHLVINNQIGFTTVPKDARSTLYCTDIAKTFNAPVFHVNAEDPEICFQVALMAMEIRQKFHCEVFIEMNCYRKYGHNESDEPAFTQPLEYALIRSKKSIREIYRDDLLNQGILERKVAEDLERVFKEKLQEAMTEAKSKTPFFNKPPKDPSELKKQDALLFNPIKTAVDFSNLEKAADLISLIPEGFSLHPKLEALVKERRGMVKTGEDVKPLDWGMAETLAYATLLLEDKSIRLTGQDSGRGTFSHRHGLWVDQKQEKNYFPLQHVSKQARFDLINSPLSEFAALGFEFGYSTAWPSTLVLWEAQFGDFANGGQIIIDQYIATSEQKWGQKSSLTLLLPHGYEGQGPEHSSARIERFLSLAGNNNLFIVNPTTPAQLFHLIRKQALKTNLSPLVIFTPKGLLRHPLCVSPVADLTKGTFQEVIDDQSASSQAKILLFCSGRVYYDLLQERSKTKVDHLCMIRIEQLYPLHEDKIKELLQKYKDIEKVYWVQEEPKNMGAWMYMQPALDALLPKNLEIQYLGRDRSASPAAGSYALHKKEYANIMNVLFTKEVN